METKTDDLKVVRHEATRETYESPAIEDLGQIHEVTQHHGKIGSPKDAPQGGGDREHIGDDSGVVGE